MMQSEHDFSSGAQADQMLQVILNKMNAQKSNIEHTMAIQLDQFKEDLREITSSVSSKVTKLKNDQCTLKNSGICNKDQYKNNENGL